MAKVERRELACVMAHVTLNRVADWVEDNLPASFAVRSMIRESDCKPLVTVSRRKRLTGEWFATTIVFPGYADEAEVDDLMVKACQSLSSSKAEKVS